MSKISKSSRRRKSSALKYWWWQKEKFNKPIRESEAELSRLKGEFADLSTANLYANVKNPYADIETEFENVYEDAIGVNMAGADLATKEFHQNLATTLQKMQEIGMVNAQQLASASLKQSQETRSLIGGQVRESEILAAQGEEKVQTREAAAEMKVAEGKHAAEMTRIQGAVDARNLEYQKTQGLMALEAAELEAARANKAANRNWFQRVFG